MSRSALLAVAVVFSLTACEGTLPVAPEADPAAPAAVTGSIASVIQDGHEEGGNPGFHFLPPVRPGTPYRPSEPFAAELHPFLVVEVCEADAAGCVEAPLATFSSDPADAPLRSQPRAGVFTAIWDLDAHPIDPTRTHRIQVRAGDAILGYADVADIRQLQGDGGEGDEGQEFPIRFTVEVGALAEAGGAIAGPDTESVELLGGVVRLDLPPGAIGAPTVLNARRLPSDFAFPSGGDPVAGLAYDFGPDGVTFPVPVTMTLAFDPALLPPGTDVAGLRIHKISGGAYALMDGGAVDPIGETVSALVDGFSAFVALAGGGPSAIPLVPTQVAAGRWHSCALDPTGSAYCWGRNSNGQLGDGSGTPSAVPAPVAGGLSFTQIVAGVDHTCGLDASGAAWCWGDNYYGQIGNGTSTDVDTPAPVSGGVSFVDISAGSYHTCGLDAGGAAHCWGPNWNGELGDGTTTWSSSPVAVAGGWAFTQIVAGANHACGLEAAGSARCWGLNLEGQLGTGNTANSTVPVPVASGLAFEVISAGAAHVCGLDDAGTAYCWGSNVRGQLGDGTDVFFTTTPGAVGGGLTFAQLVSGTFHVCGLEANGAAHCWGRNSSGQLGDGITIGGFTNSAAPVSGGFSFAELVPGDLHTCGIEVGGAVVCWGNNFHGQLGRGPVPEDRSAVPLAIVPF